MYGPLRRRRLNRARNVQPNYNKQFSFLLLQNQQMIMQQQNIMLMMLNNRQQHQPQPQPHSHSHPQPQQQPQPQQHRQQLHQAQVEQQTIVPSSTHMSQISQPQTQQQNHHQQHQQSHWKVANQQTTYVTEPKDHIEHPGDGLSLTDPIFHTDLVYHPENELDALTPFKDDVYNFTPMSDYSGNSYGGESLATPHMEPNTTSINTDVAKNLNTEFRSPIKNKEETTVAQPVLRRQSPRKTAAAAAAASSSSNQQSGSFQQGSVAALSCNIQGTPGKSNINFQIVPDGHKNLKDSKAKIIQRMNISKFLRQVHTNVGQPVSK